MFAPLRSPRIRALVLTCFAIAGPSLFAAAADAVIHHVPGPYANIQSALDSAAAGDTVLVAPGTYAGPGNRDLDFGGKDVVLRSEIGPLGTVIDCQSAGRGAWFHHHETAAACLEGFTIRRGMNAQVGGGIHCDNASPTISNCVISGGSAATGGGVACFYFSSPRFVDCRIAGNTAGEGGAVYCFYARTPVFERCFMTGNSATAAGGGISSRYGSAPVLRNCTVAGNRAATGGGIYLYQGSASVDRSIVWGNCAGEGRLAYIASASPLQFTCSDVDSAGRAGFGTTQYNGPQVFTDPMFCDPSPCTAAPFETGDYGLDAGSPCLPAHSPCGELIGASDVVCGATSSVAITGGDAPRLPLAVQPNPAQSGTGIALELAEAADIRVVIIDARGRVVRELAHGIFGGGKHVFRWNGRFDSGRRASSGTYFARIETVGATSTCKFVLVE